MTIKGYTQGYIVQYVVADLDGTVIDTFDSREEAKACAEEGQQIVELDGYGFVAEITDASGTDDETSSSYLFDGPSIADQCEDPLVNLVSDYGAAQPYNPGLAPRFPWTRG